MSKTKKGIALSLDEVLEQEGISKVEMARRMGTSRSALDRFLDPENTSITLRTMERAAIALGKKLHLKLHETKASGQRKKKAA